MNVAIEDIKDRLVFIYSALVYLCAKVVFLKVQDMMDSRSGEGWRRYAQHMLLVLFTMWGATVFAQGTNEQFGQSRVQYKDFEWQFFESEHFTTYFYLGGQDIGKYSIMYAEKAIDDIEQQLEFKANKRMQIFVYNDLSDLNQTNLGQGLELYNTGGLTKVLENKMFVYFNGNHADLEKQIRIGIAQVLIKHMMFGGNFQEILQNAVLLNLPQWFTDGLVSYVGEPWSPELDARLRDGILSGKFEKFNRLRGEDAVFAGHAIWHYVEQKYGKASVPNLLYLARVNRSLESGFLFVLGGDVKQVTSEWYEYYYDQFTRENAEHQDISEDSYIKKRRWKKRDHYEPKISPDGRYVSYVTNELGQWKVYLHDTEDSKTDRVKKGGFKTVALVTDQGYPLMDWAPNGEVLAVIYEKRDQLYLLLYDLETGKKEKTRINKFQQIHDFCFTDDPRMLIMSAVRRGNSDIFTYFIPSTTTEQLTNDHYDDIEVGFVNTNGRKGVLFASNRVNETLKNERLDTTLLNSNFDLFFYNLTTKPKALARVTSTPFYNEKQPVQHDADHFSFLTDANGMYQRYAGYIDKTISHYDTVAYFPDSVVENPKWSIAEMKNDSLSLLDSVRIFTRYKDVGYVFPLSDYNTSIDDHDVAFRTGKTVNLVREKTLFKLSIMPTEEPIASAEKPKNSNYQAYRLTNLRRDLARQEAKDAQQLEIEKALAGDGELPDSLKQEKVLFFQSPFATAPEIVVDEFVGDIYGKLPLGPTAGGVFQQTKVAPYRLKFSTDYVLSQIDNSLIMTRYDLFAPGQPVFNNPPLSATINLGISDLMEDIRITGGFRFPFDFQGSEYWVAYENLRNRLDRRVMYYRQVENQTYNDVVPFYNIPVSNNPTRLPVEGKVKTNYFEYRMNYAIDPIRSVRLYFAWRHDNYVFRSQDDFSLNLPNVAENWTFAKLEFVHDNTIPLGINLRQGVRFKAWAEIHKQIPMRRDTILGDIRIRVPELNDAYLAVFGLDFRWYQKIHRELIWANRVAWGSSIGTRKMVYYLGGVDNWLGASFDNNTAVNEDNDYAFQTLATNMRGFKQNVRNGNSFFVLNSEIRFPIFKYFFNTPIKSEFLKNLQIVGFTDIGTAWEGVNPYADDNPLFRENIGQPPVEVEVEYFKNPIVFGYGFGMRTTLFGYFIRLDVAWGNDSGVKSDRPMIYFSFAQDF